MLGDVRRAVLDFPAMADRGRRMVQLAGAGAARYADDEVDETVAFLEWLLQDHFIFLGYREYRIADETIAVVPGSGLGILADEASSRLRAAAAARRPAGRTMRERALEGDLLIVSKTNRLSTVHRRARMDYVGVRKVAARRPRSPARRGCSACSRPRPTRSRPRRRRCSTASCARSSATRT